MKLYHATFEHLLNSILEYGLNNEYIDRLNWDDSKRGVVYLTDDEDLAVSFVEITEDVPEEWLDEIVVLEIDSDNLDMDKLFLDSNILLDEDEEPFSFEYHGIIRPAAIKVL